MDYVQALFSIFIAPLLATILLGMFWKRATKIAGFLGLLFGIVFSVSLFVWVHLNPANLRYVALSPYAKPMAENVFRALVGMPVHRYRHLLGEHGYQAKAGGGVEGLVYGVTQLPKEEPVPFYKNEWTWAILVVIIFAVLNILFW